MAYGVRRAVERLLAAGAARSEIGFHPTHWRAVRNGDREVPEAPLAAGAGIMACDGCTPLRAAAEHPNSKSVKTLLDFGADANARSMSGTPLHLTERRTDPKALEIPLQAGADIHVASAMYPRTEDELMNVTAPARGGGGERGRRGETASRARRRRSCYGLDGLDGRDAAARRGAGNVRETVELPVARVADAKNGEGRTPTGSVPGIARR